MSTVQQPEVAMTITPVAGTEVKKFMAAEGVDPTVGGLRRRTLLEAAQSHPGRARRDRRR